MTNRLMLSVAAIALIAGAGAVNAQGTGGRESGGASTQQSAPSSAGGGAANSGGAAMQHEGSERSPGASSGMKSDSKSDMKSSQSEQSPGAARNQRADEQGQKSKGMSSENETKGGMKSEGHDNKQDNKNAQNREGRDRDQNAAQNREGRDRDQNAAQNRDRNGNMNAEGKSSTDMKSQTTTGQAGSGAKLSSEQRTKITTVIRNEHVSPVTNVNFAVSVGTRVPRDVSFHSIPSEVVTIYPEWRGYNYILVRQQIVVIDPSTYEIVAVLDV